MQDMVARPGAVIVIGRLPTGCLLRVSWTGTAPSCRHHQGALSVRVTLMIGPILFSTGASGPCVWLWRSACARAIPAGSAAAES